MSTIEQPRTPDKGIDSRLVGGPDIASKVRSGQSVTIVISQDSLSLYLNAGTATDFKVEKIAGEGEEYPHFSGQYKNKLMETKDGKYYNGKLQREVTNVKVLRKGYIAVSIERPEDSKDHTPFWENLRSLDQNKA